MDHARLVDALERDELVEAAAPEVGHIHLRQHLARVFELDQEIAERVDDHRAVAGGVGVLAVQIAKAKGCYVIGTTSETNIPMVKSLGADEVIDYKKYDFSQVLKGIDVVFDTVGGATQENSWKVLKEGGILVSITSPPSAELAKQHKVQSGFVFIKPNATVLNELTKLIDAGKLKPVISKVFNLNEIKQAQELSQTGRTKGKIVIKVTT